MKSKRFFLLLAASTMGLIFFSCKNQPAQQAQKTQDSDEPFEEFLQFHAQFLADSIFQMEHILFPLEGLPSNADSLALAEGKFRWTEDNWELHQPFNFDESDYKQQFVPFDDDLILEKIVHETGGYALERRFGKIEGTWYLIYYAGLNQLR